MTTQNLLIFLLVGIVAGFLAGKIMRGAGFGLFGDMVVGVLGAFIGGWLFARLGVVAGGIAGLLVTALIGAMVLLFLIRLIRRA
jgi:uncharacterized membrane protein YeaQ/YmgE (transglycosylase-associated protein family)